MRSHRAPQQCERVAEAAAQEGSSSEKQQQQQQKQSTSTLPPPSSVPREGSSQHCNVTPCIPIPQQATLSSSLRRAQLPGFQTILPTTSGHGVESSEWIVGHIQSVGQSIQNSLG